jgi:hypothetical protein
MWASRREEALRRAAELAAMAEVARADAQDARLAAERVEGDVDSRASLERSAAEMDFAAEQYDGVAESYLAMAEGRQDDDGDGYW